MIKEQYVAEMRLLRVKKAPKTAGRRRWRWDVTIYKMVDGANGGVKDRRQHMGTLGGSSYTYTRWGALREIGKAYDKARKIYDMQ